MRYNFDSSLYRYFLIFYSLHASVIIFSVTLSAKEPLRTWTNADGRSLKAKYISSSADKVTIKMGSREYTLPLSDLSLADQQYLADLASKPTSMIVAHRGSSYEAPENTLPAFELAWEQGADAVEGDFLLTQDGKIVCFHDRDTKRLTRQKMYISKTSFADLQKLDVGKWKDEKFRGTRMPLISDVFATIPSGKKIFVEVKCGPEIVEPLIKEIKKSGLKDDQVVLICFKQDVIKQFKKARPQHKAYWLCRIKKIKGEWTPSLASVLSTLKTCRADGLHSYFAIPEEYTNAVLDSGYEWHAWTVNDPQVAKELVGRSISSITTDRPMVIREALK